MKRDMDLIRLLLLELEGVQEVDLSPYTKDQIGYHKFQLVSAGLARGVVEQGDNEYYPDVELVILTWEGHDFLDAARDETRWRKVNATLGSAAFDAIKQILVALTVTYGKSELGLP